MQDSPVVDESPSIPQTHIIAGENIQRYMLISIQKQLKIEVGTGLKSRANPASQAREILAYNGIRPKRNKADLLEQFTLFLADLGVLQVTR